jgi:hypothetical protein
MAAVNSVTANASPLKTSILTPMALILRFVKTQNDD